MYFKALISTKVCGVIQITSHIVQYVRCAINNKTMSLLKEPHRQCGDGSLGRAPHSTHCGKFLLCSNGDPWMVMDCPGGTLFNVYTTQCDHADLVDCGTRNATGKDTFSEKV